MTDALRRNKILLLPFSFSFSRIQVDYLHQQKDEYFNPFLLNYIFTSTYNMHGCIRDFMNLISTVLKVIF